MNIRTCVLLIMLSLASSACMPPLEVVGVATEVKPDANPEGADLPLVVRAPESIQIEFNNPFAAAWLAAHSDQEDAKVFLRFHVQVRNTGNVALDVHSVVADTDTTGNLQLVLDEDQSVIEAGESDVYKVEYETHQPMPSIAGIRFVFEGIFAPAIFSWPVVAYQNETYTGGYRFPARAEDLPPGHYWAQGTHAHATDQSYALDLGVNRWDENLDAWTKYTEQAYIDADAGIPLGSINEHYLIWDVPVYSMYDGLIIKCRRLEPDNTPPTKSSGGNMVMVDHGNGEYGVYYHLKYDSVPEALCPEEIHGTNDELDTPIPISAGDLLGTVGNSGLSTNPHLHLQLNDRAPSDSGSYQAYPLNFHDVEVHGRDGYDPDDATAPGWNFVSADAPANMGHSQLLLPNPNGWSPGQVAVPTIDPVFEYERPGTDALDFGRVPQHVTDTYAMLRSHRDAQTKRRAEVRDEPTGVKD